MNLHESIMSAMSSDWDLKESNNFPEGITPQNLSEMSKSFDRARFLFVPADMVPESKTARRIASLDQDLSSRYVMYNRARKPMHDPTYG